MSVINPHFIWEMDWRQDESGLRNVGNFSDGTGKWRSGRRAGHRDRADAELGMEIVDCGKIERCYRAPKN